MKKLPIALLIALLQSLHAMEQHKVDQSLGVDWIEISENGQPTLQSIPPLPLQQTAPPETSPVTITQPNPELVNQPMTEPQFNSHLTPEIVPNVPLLLDESDDKIAQHDSASLYQKWYTTKTGRFSLIVGGAACVGIGTVVLAYQLFKK